MSHSMDTAALKAKDAALRQANESEGNKADKLEARATYALLVALQAQGKLAGTTKLTAEPVLAVYKVLRESFGAVALVLHDAEEPLRAFIVTSGKQAEVEQLLVGPSVKLIAQQVPPAAFQYIKRTEAAGMTPERFLQVHAAVLAALEKVVNDVEAAVDNFDAAASKAEGEIQQLQARAANSCPTELTAAMASLTEARGNFVTDPLGAYAAIALEVNPLLDLVSKRLQASRIKNDREWQQFATTLSELQQKSKAKHPQGESPQAAAAYAQALECVNARNDLQQAEELVAAYAVAAL